MCLVVTYGIGFNMLASYNLQSTFSSYGFYNPEVTPWFIGLIIAIIVAYCLFGGGSRIIKVTTFLVPVMGIAYILISLVVIVLNISNLPTIFKLVFTEAFDLKAIFGGFSGSCVMYGIKRGLFSNEAGVGSAPNASASAEVSHPVKQGLVQILSVFIGTILVCSATAFMWRDLNLCSRQRILISLMILIIGIKFKESLFTALFPLLCVFIFSQIYVRLSMY